VKSLASIRATNQELEAWLAKKTIAFVRAREKPTPAARATPLAY